MTKVERVRIASFVSKLDQHKYNKKIKLKQLIHIWNKMTTRTYCNIEFKSIANENKYVLNGECYVSIQRFNCSKQINWNTAVVEIVRECQSISLIMVSGSGVRNQLLSFTFSNWFDFISVSFFFFFVNICTRPVWVRLLGRPSN